MEKIVLIVPIYNVEKYLRQCLDSIKNQTYKNFICIMINDGSTDTSKIIAEQYLSDSRFILINQENKGLSGARNTGIEYFFKYIDKEYICNYVTFIDSDDVVSLDYLEYLVSNIEDGVDIIEANICFFDENDVPYFSSTSNNTFVLETVEEKLMNQLKDDIRTSIFPKLINKKLLTLNFFPEGKIFEDIAVMGTLINNSNRWKKLPKIIYGYRVRKGSIINTKFSNKKLDIFEILEIYRNNFMACSIEAKILVEEVSILHLTYHLRDFVPKMHKSAKLYANSIVESRKRIESYKSNFPKALISIIVPIDNVSSSLELCLKSIENQSYPHFEVILINDGSTDNSKEICEEFVFRDKRFKYIEVKDAGFSNVRNIGILNSNGECITFINGKDFVESNYLKELYDNSVKYNSEIVIGSYTKFNEVDNNYYFYAGPYREEQYLDHDIIDNIPKLIKYRENVESNCGILFHKKLFNNVLFPMNKRGANESINYKLFLESKKITYINKELYTYRIRKESITHNINEKILTEILDELLEKIAILSIVGINISEVKESFHNRIKELIEQATDTGLENTEIYRRYKEILYFLDK